MLTDETAKRVRKNPKYDELVRKRTSFAWILSAIILVIYYGFIMAIAFDPAALGTPLSQGSVTTIGMPIGIGVILSAIVLTGVYVWRANTEFDNLTRKLIEDTK